MLSTELIIRILRTDYERIELFLENLSCSKCSKRMQIIVLAEQRS